MPTDPDAELTPWIALGAGGHAASVADALLGVARLAAVVGDSSRSWSVPVLDSDEQAIEQARALGQRLIVTVGDNARRIEVLSRVPEALLLTAAAGTATVAAEVTLGPSTVVLHHAHVGPGARIGRGAIINTAAVVEHDVTLGDGVHVAPAAVLLGGAWVGAGAFIGSGARVLPGIRVGAGAVVGAGSVVTCDVPDRAIVVGVPAVRRTCTGRSS